MSDFLTCNYIIASAAKEIVIGCNGCVLQFGNFTQIPYSRWEGFIANPPKFKVIEAYDEAEDYGKHGCNFCMMREGDYIRIKFGGGGGRKGVDNQMHLRIHAQPFLPLLEICVKKLLANNAKFDTKYDYEDQDEAIRVHFKRMNQDNQKTVPKVPSVCGTIDNDNLVIDNATLSDEVATKYEINCSDILVDWEKLQTGDFNGYFFI